MAKYSYTPKLPDRRVVVRFWYAVNFYSTSNIIPFTAEGNASLSHILNGILVVPIFFDIPLENRQVSRNDILSL